MSSSIHIKDQLGRPLHFEKVPQRIVSLVPSITELLVDLGLADYLVGRTLFCIHPESINKKVRKIGGTKTLKIEQIQQLQPDLIIANKEENTASQIATLAAEFTVYISEINTIEASYQFIQAMGNVLGVNDAANAIIVQHQQIIASVNQRYANPIKVAYLIWKAPYMAVAANTFIDDMLKKSGMVNVFAHANSRYPKTSIAELNNKNIDLLLLSSEPFPFKEKHILEMQAEGLNIPCVLVDGEHFSWYGSRLLHVQAQFIASLTQIKSML